jgi:hypothetical protein
MKSVGNQELWKWMLDKYMNESNAQEKLKLLRGLTAISEPWILSYLLQLAKDDTIIRSQDYFTLLIYLSWNRVGVPVVWDFVRTEWPYLVDRFTTVKFGYEIHLTRFWPLLTTYPPPLTLSTFYKKSTFFDYLPPFSCKSSL